jgi:cation:H+ antiporter
MESRTRSLGLDIGLIVGGLVMLVFGAQRTVIGAIAIAEALHINSLIIGLTVVAAGTSLPELSTSVLASLKGEWDLAVGNVVGSNIFNILGVQGLASLVSSSGVQVDPSAIRFDLLVMIAAAIACLPIFFTGYVIARWEGALFIGYFLAYLGYVYLQAAQREVLGIFNLAMISFVVPITIVTLAVVVLRERRRNKARR